MPKIFVTGDLHGSVNGMQHRFGTRHFKKKLKQYKKYELTKDDIVIQLGDFGLVWDHRGENNKEANALDWLNDKPWTTVFIDGNHDNHPRLFSLPTEERFGGPVGILRDSIYYLKRGEVYDFLGKKFFCMGGAASIDKMHRITGVSWWPEEVPNHQEIEHALDTMKELNYKCDYVLAHTLPQFIIPQVTGVSRDKFRDPTAKFMEHIYREMEFKRYFCGHFHEDRQLTDITILFHAVVELNLDTDEIDWDWYS